MTMTRPKPAGTPDEARSALPPLRHERDATAPETRRTTPDPLSGTLRNAAGGVVLGAVATLSALATAPTLPAAATTLALALAAHTAPLHAQQEGTFTLNLKNADIHSLIQTVSRQSGRNFVVDPRVKARVTVISSEPLDAGELYETFLSVLQVHGYAAVPQGDLIKIVPDVNAKQGPVPAYTDEESASDQLVTRVIKVANVPAAQLVPILRPLVPQQGHLAAYAATNTLIVTDRASNIERLSTIISEVDRPDNEEVEIVNLRYAAAAEIIRILQSLQNRGAQVGTPGQVRFASDDRTNAILLSGEKAARARMRSIIMDLDSQVESGGNTRVIYLRYANAVDLLEILTGVSAGQATIGTGGGDEEGGDGGQESAPASFDADGLPIPQEPQVPTASLIRRATEEASGPNVDIQADEDTNALIITAPPDEMRSILSVISQLDIRRAQVLVEAIIAELSATNSSQLGVNFAVYGESGNRPAAYTNLGGATQDLAAIALSEGTSGLANGLSLALGRFGSGGVDFGVLLSAIASDSDNNILSTPTLVTMDNQEAEIVVGQNVPFVTGTQLSSSNDNPFQTIERQDIGISLKVKPQINEGDNIKMEIEQEVSDVANTAVTGASDIVTNTRSIKTTVLVEDGQTLVLGGLIDDQVSDTRDKVPLLGDIPLLGSLFRYRTASKRKRNLMVFLHPTILRDPATADYYSRSKYDDVRQAQLGLFEDPETLSTVARAPLPDLHLYLDGERVAAAGELNTIVPTLDEDTLVPTPSTDLQSLPDVDPPRDEPMEGLPAPAGSGTE